MDVSKLLDDFDQAIAAVDQAQGVVDDKQTAVNRVRQQLQSALDKADKDLVAASADHQKKVEVVNAMRETIDAALAERGIAATSGRVR